MKICIPTTYSFRPAGAETVLPAEQQSVALAEASL
jgi:hypothetical protein